MYGKRILRIGILVAATVLLRVAAGDAARLDLVHRDEVHSESRNGRSFVAAPATGQGIGTIANFFNITLLANATMPWNGTQTNEQTIAFDIMPDDGESAGQCVVVDYFYNGTGHVEASGPAAARIGVGGPESIQLAIDPIALSFANPATIVLQSGGVDETILTAGPLVGAPGEPDLAIYRQGSFVARIGDTIHEGQAAASVWNVQPGGSTSGLEIGQINATVRPGIVACPAGIPATSTWGLILLTILLAGVGIFVARRTVG